MDRLSSMQGCVKHFIALTFMSLFTVQVSADPMEPDYNNNRIPIYGNVCGTDYLCISNTIQSGCTACASSGLVSNQLNNAFDDNANSFWMSNSVTTETGCWQDLQTPEIIIDLGQPENIEALQLYYWQNYCGCGDYFLNTKIYLSNDQFNWGSPVQEFPFVSNLSTRTYSSYVPISAQFIRIEFGGCPEPWSKVSINEIKIFGPDNTNTGTGNGQPLDCDAAMADNYLISKNVDPDGIALPAPSESEYAYGDILGINAGPEWDCFYNSGACGANPLKGLVTHVRSFHLQEKDYQNHNASGEPGCSDCPGPTTQCTPAQRGAQGPLKIGYDGGIDLYKLRYQQWAADGFDNIQASLEAIHLYCENGARAFPQKWWTEEEWGGEEHAYDNARAYGRVFAENMCPNDNDCLIRHLEVGNEPWQYRDPCFYQEILKGVIDGVKEYYESEGLYNPENWPMKLLPGAFQAYRDDIENEDYSQCDIYSYCDVRYDFIGTRLPRDYFQYLDGLSVHPYAFNTSHYRMDEHPEAPASQSEMPRFKSMIHWMNNNMPGKKIFVSEFGWDSQLVGNVAQGIYLLRSTLIFGRHNIYRATMYTTRDEVGAPGSPGCYVDGLYNTSGLLTDDSPPDGGCVTAPNSKKIAFYVMQEMVDKIGSKVFKEIVSEDNNAYAYLIGDKNAAEPSHIVAWSPERMNSGNDYNSSDLYVLSDPVELTLPITYNFNGGQIEWLDGILDNSYDSNLATIGNGTLTLPLAKCPILIPLNTVNPTENTGGTTDDSVCGDGIQNGDETGIDCGGLMCNLAEGKYATQSCDQANGTASLAVDGNSNGVFYEDFSVTHTCWQNQPWWQIDLGQVEDIDRIRIFNRTDANYQHFKNYYILLSNNPFPNGSLDDIINDSDVELYYETSLVGSPSSININYSARYVRIQLEEQGFICISELEIIKGCNVAPVCDPQGATCDDGDPNTIDDIWDGDCNCAGTAPGCDPQGTTCDDGNNNTTNDVWDGNCNCFGTPISTDCMVNVAENQAASQSCKNQGGSASRAVDGNTSGNFYQDYSIALTCWQNNAWWEVDLGAVYDIQDINIYNRTDANMEQLTNYHVFVSDTEFVDHDLYATKIQFDVSDFYMNWQAGTPTVVSANRSGRYVRVQLEDQGFLGIAEVEVMACVPDSGPIGRVVEDSDTEEAEGLKAWAEPDKSREIMLFPNPTNSILYIDLTKLAGFNARMQLYSNAGQLIDTYNYEPVPNDLVHINILDYPNGTYFLKIHLTEDVVITKQFVIMK